MNSVYERGLRANIWKLSFFAACLKRPYLPLIAIYSVSVAHLSLYKLGIVAAVASAVSFILEVPSGYIADKLGHKKALILANLITGLAPLFYVFMPNFEGMILASGLFFGGVAFYSGIRQAFLHETLIELGQGEKYSKAEARITRIGLLGNTALVALVPISYVYNKNLPFLISSAICFVSFFIAFTLVTPIKTKREANELEHVSLPALLHSLRPNGMYILFFLLGISATMYDKIPTFREIYFSTLGIPVTYFGFLLAAGSLLGALLSLYIPRFAQWKENKFYLFDVLVSVGLIVLVGLTHNAYLGVLWFTLITAYDRNRDSVIHSFLLARSPTRELKATYISLLNFSGEIQGIWMPLLLGYLVGKLGINSGYLYFGILFSLPMLALYLWYIRKNSHRAR